MIHTMNGWTKIKHAAEYAGIKERTMRTWLKQGLRFSRLPTGTVLIRYSAIDEFLESYEVQDNEIDKIVDEVLS